jgi:hypothetical protein
MKTTLLDNAENNATKLYRKVAEGPEDLRALARIRDNIALLQSLVPDMAPEVIEENEEVLLIKAARGNTYGAEPAVPVYESQPWIMDAVLAQLDQLQVAGPTGGPSSGERIALLRHILRPLRFGVSVPLPLVGPFLSLTFRSHDWVLTHGDLHTRNIVVDNVAQEITLIDWENFALRPRYYDEYRLAFHRCVPVYEMTWQREFLQQCFQDQPRGELISTQALALAVLYYYYGKEPQRDQSAELLRVRSAVRHQNMMLLANRANWEKWLDWVRA